MFWCWGEGGEGENAMEERSSSARLFYAAAQVAGMHRPDIIHEAEVCLAPEMIKQDEQASPPITNRSHVPISTSQLPQLALHVSASE